MVTVAGSRTGGRITYAVQEIDHFFLIDDDLNAYLIPAGTVAGRQQLSLRRYSDFQVAASGRWLMGATDVDSA